ENKQMAASQEDGDDAGEFTRLFTSYLGLSFAIFLGSLPRNSIPLVSLLQSKNQALSRELADAEDQLRQLLSRRKEDSKANARVVEIFASHRHAWQQEEKKLLQQIDECNDEIAYLKGKVEDSERAEADLKAANDELKREISEKDEMLNFMSRGGGNVPVSGGLDLVGVEDNFSGGGGQVIEEFGTLYSHRLSGSDDYFNAASKFSLFQDLQQESSEPVKHFVARRELPWKVDGGGVSPKLKSLEQELLNLDRIRASKIPGQLQKQAKRYQTLAAKLDDLCRRMQTSDPCDASLSPEFRSQRQTEFLLEAFRLQQRASETGQKLMALQSYWCDGVEIDVAARRSVDSIRNNLKEVQRNLEIWLARIIGDLEGILARESSSSGSRTREYYNNASCRYPFGQ
ncbi:hypothetical protein M569_08407, partial [Genlisea aurea]